MAGRVCNRAGSSGGCITGKGGGWMESRLVILE